DEKLARERQLAELSSQAHYTGFDAVRKRLSLRFGILKQNFGSKMGLAGVMMKGIGFGFLINDRLAVDFSRFSGTTTLMQSTGAEQISLPSSLAGLDTLSISTGSWQVALRYSFGGIPGIPLLKTADNYIYAGLRHMSLESSAAERGSASQGLWGPVVGFGFQQRLFSRLKLDAGFRGFLSSTEVTDVRSSGSSLLTEKKVFLFNPAFFGGVSWCF
ncbi:MAG: hypothetical protein U9N45_01675, partial [Gemmatimonadota bacterium]|nr:hypothetical protein [Gemmatimonadota bacterium]